MQSPHRKKYILPSSGNMAQIVFISLQQLVQDFFEFSTAEPFSPFAPNSKRSIAIRRREYIHIYIFFFIFRYRLNYVPIISACYPVIAVPHHASVVQNFVVHDPHRKKILALLPIFVSFTKKNSVQVESNFLQCNELVHYII